MNLAYFFIVIFFSCSKSGENWFSNVCNSSQRPKSKNTFTSNSNNQNDFFNKSGWYTFFLFYVWAKYEPIWTDFTAQTVTLGANLLVKAQTIPQNAKCALFFSPKVVFTSDFGFLNTAKVFEIWLFCIIEICENA